MPSLDLKITRGLSLFDCQDHHAILGVPINSEAKVIRKRYLYIARLLHPDSVSEGINKEMASVVLSKLINPSYEFLSQPNQMEEYNILLRLVGQRYTQEQHRFKISSNEAKAVLQAKDPEKTYQDCIAELSQYQFLSLDRYGEITSTISEVNLLYLYRQEGAPAPAVGRSQVQSPPPPSSTQGSSPSRPQKTFQNNRSTTSIPSQTPRGASTNPQNSTLSGGNTSTVNYDLVNQYCRRAEELIAKDCYLEAIRELKEVVEGNNPIDPNNSRVLMLLGDIYKDHMKQPVMARPFYTRALRSDPDNDQARKKLADMAPSTPKSSKSPAKGSNTEAEKTKFGFLNFLSRKK